MKRFISFMLLIVLIFSMSSLTFATDLQSDVSIYASSREIASIKSSIKNTFVTKTLNDFKMTFDFDTIMPVYYASLYDYAETGKLEYAPFCLNGKQLYVSDVIDNTGDFSGVALFNIDDIHMFVQSTDMNKSIDFSTINSKRISTLTASNTTYLTNKAKMMFVEGLGFVYYIENENEIMLVASTLKGTNGDIFTSENNGIVFVDENLLQISESLVEKREEYDNYLSTLKPGENPNTGVSTPPFAVDNSIYNSLFELSLEQIAATMFAISVVFAGLYLLVSKKTKDDKTI